MARVKFFKIFGLAFLCGLVLMLTSIFISRPRAEAFTKARLFAPGLSVTEQISTTDIAAIKKDGYKTIVDFRPGGEAPDQVPSATMERVARANGMSFSYIPVPHGPIPDSAVAALDSTLSKSPRPVLLYCRSGKRAARTLSLYEASRADGPDAAGILAMVQGVGQSADDLSSEINQRIAHRNQATGAAK